MWDILSCWCEKYWGYIPVHERNYLYMKASFDTSIY